MSTRTILYKGDCQSLSLRDSELEKGVGHVTRKSNRDECGVEVGGTEDHVAPPNEGDCLRGVPCHRR